MNSSGTAGKSSAGPPESSGSNDNMNSSETNQPKLSYSEDTPDKISGKEENSIVYDLEDFKKAKKDWIRTFFNSKKNNLKKLIGVKEIDYPEKKELQEIDTEHILPATEKTPALSDERFQSDQENSSEELSKSINSENFKRIRIDLKSYKAFTKKQCNSFLRKGRSATSEFISRNKADLKIFSAKQKHAPVATASYRKAEVQDFFQNFKVKSGEHFNIRKEDLREFFDMIDEDSITIIKSKSDVLQNADCSDNRRKAAKKYIRSERKKINDFLAKKKKFAKKQLTEVMQEFDNRTASVKKSIKKSIMPDKLSMFELFALIESNNRLMADFISSVKQVPQMEAIKSDNENTAALLDLIESNKKVMKDFIDSQIGIQQTFTNPENGIPPPKTFRDLEEIKASIPREPVYSSPPVASETPQGIKKIIKVLLAEDDLLLRKSLSFYLTHNGFEIVQVTNGLEAMEEIHKTTFDVIILDLQMPHMGGLEIIDRVRNQLHLDTKIIVLTASGVEEVELKSFNMGATDFIAKPFSPSVVKARIEKIMAGDAV